jgi:vitamin B12 transporter
MTIHTKRFNAALAVTTLFCLFNSASAQQQDIETLTVTGSRIPVSITKIPTSISVLTEDDITASGAVQITELIRGLPGVSLSQSGSPGGLTEVRVRGGETNHLLVLIDGVIANDIGQGSLIDLAHLTTANVARIELLRGPQSALWGSGAIGGVLSITTKTGQVGNNDADITLSLAGGTQDTFRGSVNSVSQFDNLGVNAYANYFVTDGDNISRVGNEDDGYENVTAGINANYSATDAHTFIATLRAVDYNNDYDGTDFVTTGLPTDANNRTDGSQLSTKLQWRYTPIQSDYASVISFQYRKDENDNTTEGIDAGGTTGERLEVNWTNTFDVSEWNIAAGSEYLQRLFSQRGPINFGDPNQKQHDNTLSVFGEASRQLSQTLFTTLSARLDDNSEFKNATTYRAGLTWDVSSSIAVFSSVGKAVKTPTFTERFGFFPDSFAGNPSLIPEKSEEVELGLRGNTRNINWQVSAYNARLENEINGFVFSPDLGIFTADNVDGKSKRRGIDTEMTWSASWATFSASYSYLDANQPNSTNTSLATELRRARHQGALTATSSLGIDKLSVYAKLAYTGTRFDTFFPPFPEPSQTLALSAYTLATFNVQYQLTDALSVALKVNNAFNADFEDIIGYQGQERRALLTFAYQM